MCSFDYLLNITTCKHMTQWWWQRKKTSMWQVALLCPDANQTDRVWASSGFPARCQSSEVCYLSRREVLEVVEGQVGDQVSSVSDEWLMTSGDIRGGHAFAVPKAKCQLLVRSHVPQVFVDGFPPGKKRQGHILFKLCDLLIHWISANVFFNIVLLFLTKVR